LDNVNAVIQVISNYINPVMLGVTLALWFIGTGLKQTPKIPNWAILWILSTLGVLGGLLVVGMGADGFIQGILAAALSIYGHQAVKQTATGIKESE
jgi:cytochrome bd-type quinol oxidase subunit 2